MQRNYSLLVVVSIVILGAQAIAAGKYNVAAIPEGLRKGFDAVVREQSITLVIKKNEQARYTVRRAVTVFRQSERDQGVLQLNYDRFTTIDDLDGRIYDAEGEKVRDLEKQDVRDFSAIEDFSLYEDSRVRVASLFHNQYPYTVEYVYSLDFEISLGWPPWYAQWSLIPVEHSRCEVLTPPGYALRYWCNRDTVMPAISRGAKQDSYVWEANNLQGIPKDQGNEDFEDMTTVVRFAPHSIDVDGWTGTMKSWKEFGQWFHGLRKGRDILPAKASIEAKASVEAINDPKEKVRKLYRLLQEKTRYVNVTLGIGGWQPFDARFVYEHGYGDCKALSNYMVSMLGAIGIQAFPVLIRNGYYRYPMIEEFPSNQFNHVIVCAPLQSDTMWLECTSQSKPPGFIGSTNENRPALMITPEGGIVVHTPRSTSQQNVQRTRCTVALQPNGAAVAKVGFTVTGNQQDDVRGSLHRASPEERERWAMGMVQTPNSRLESMHIEGMEEQDPEMRVSLSLSSPKFASLAGTRLFLKPNVLNRGITAPPKAKQRLSPIRFRYAYLDEDSVLYTIPATHRLENVPKPVSISTSFGKFQARSEVVGDSILVYVRTLEVTDPSIPADLYEEYRIFFQEIQKSDNAQVVLVKK